MIIEIRHLYNINHSMNNKIKINIFFFVRIHDANTVLIIYHSSNVKQFNKFIDNIKFDVIHGAKAY
jgi:hypothetical protein